MPFAFKRMAIHDVILIEPKVFRDDRGFFVETYKTSDFVSNGIGEAFVQDNHSFSKKFVIRGLHYQLAPAAQGKLVSVVEGRALDVAVDIRRGSQTFGKWVSTELSDENHIMVFIPAGFAHGFLALTDTVHLVYKCTAEYNPGLDRGIRWDDPDISVDWGISDPVVSDKDRGLPFLKNAEVFE
ncbi:MAG: dTDP-4-dehydrorhamnose 3,5-epimerase [Spirochaetes bacterium]|nr:dTDP-4-dehydrorhamnose 3,5-epimerase [Spirochaetota bacterium]